MKTIEKIKIAIVGLILSILIGITMAWMRTNVATPFAITALWVLLLCIPSAQGDQPKLPSTAYRNDGIRIGDEPL